MTFEGSRCDGAIIYAVPDSRNTEETEAGSFGYICPMVWNSGSSQDLSLQSYYLDL